MLKYVDPNLPTITQDRSNNKSARFSGTRKVHMVTEDGEIQGTVDLNTAMERLEDVISCEFVGTIDVFVGMRTPHQYPKETWMCILSTSQRGTKHSSE